MAKAGRMLKSESMVGIGIPCILLGEVTYKRWDGATVRLAKDTKIFVDTERGWGVHGDDYFIISRGEYISVLPN